MSLRDLEVSCATITCEWACGFLGTYTSRIHDWLINKPAYAALDAGRRSTCAINIRISKLIVLRVGPKTVYLYVISLSAPVYRGMVLLLVRSRQLNVLEKPSLSPVAEPLGSYLAAGNSFASLILEKPSWRKLKYLTQDKSSMLIAKVRRRLNAYPDTTITTWPGSLIDWFY